MSSNNVIDEERELILRRKMLEIMSKAMRRTEVEAVKRELTKDEVIRLLKDIVRGERAEEIIGRAVEIYGDVAIDVFRQIVELYKQGKLKELWDYQLYEILMRLGLHVPLKTRIRIVRHGREEKLFGE